MFFYDLDKQILSCVALICRWFSLLKALFTSSQWYGLSRRIVFHFISLYFNRLLSHLVEHILRMYLFLWVLYVKHKNHYLSLQFTKMHSFHQHCFRMQAVKINHNGGIMFVIFFNSKHIFWCNSLRGLLVQIHSKIAKYFLENINQMLLRFRWFIVGVHFQFCIDISEIFIYLSHFFNIKSHISNMFLKAVGYIAIFFLYNYHILVSVDCVLTESMVTMVVC